MHGVAIVRMAYADATNSNKASAEASGWKESRSGEKSSSRVSRIRVMKCDELDWPGRVASRIRYAMTTIQAQMVEGKRNGCCTFCRCVVLAWLVLFVPCGASRRMARKNRFCAKEIGRICPIKKYRDRCGIFIRLPWEIQYVSLA